MALRNLLHKNKVIAFLAWLTEIGIEHRPGAGAYELAQINHPPGQWSKLYRRDVMAEHVTVQEALLPVVHQFIRQSKDKTSPAQQLNDAINARRALRAASEKGFVREGGRLGFSFAAHETGQQPSREPRGVPDWAAGHEDEYRAGWAEAFDQQGQDQYIQNWLGNNTD